MSDVVLGTIPTQTNLRDAIHVAVISVTAGQWLTASMRVMLVNGVAYKAEPAIGIVDPYLTTVIKTGEPFWLCLLPNTVTGMRHHWSHPLLGEVPTIEANDTSESEKWLRQYAADLNSYDSPERAFEKLIVGLKSGDLRANGSDLHGRQDLGCEDLLRFHAEAYLGTKLNFDDFTFSCSC